jgi:hypothetical protein
MYVCTYLHDVTQNFMSVLLRKIIMYYVCMYLHVVKQNFMYICACCYAKFYVRVVTQNFMCVLLRKIIAYRNVSTLLGNIIHVNTCCYANLDGCMYMLLRKIIMCGMYVHVVSQN